LYDFVASLVLHGEKQAIRGTHKGTMWAMGKQQARMPWKKQPTICWENLEKVQSFIATLGKPFCETLPNVTNWYPSTNYVSPIHVDKHDKGPSIIMLSCLEGLGGVVFQWDNEEIPIPQHPTVLCLHFDTRTLWHRTKQLTKKCKWIGLAGVKQ